MNNGIFSPALGGTPVYWEMKIGLFCHICGGQGDAITEDFRHWALCDRPTNVEEPESRHPATSAI